MRIWDKKIVIRIELKTFHFDLPKDIDINLKYENIKYNELLAEYTINYEIRQLLTKYKDGKEFMNNENSKMNEPHQFVINLSQR